MFLRRLFFALLVIACLPAVSQANPTGMIVGRTGDILHVSVPQPVAEGATLEVTMPDNGTASARVLSCTKEWPYIALAKTGGSAYQTAAPAYASAPAFIAPVHVAEKSSKKEDARFSLEAGGFYPADNLGTGTYLDVWQSYRLNYSFLKLGGLETQVSAEYMRGFSSLGSGEHQVNRTMQVVPVTLMGKLKPFRIGSWKLFVGAGGGYYPMYSEDTCDGLTSNTKTGALGHELCAGLEANGWLLEARYRNVPNTEIEGYSLALGTRF